MAGNGWDQPQELLVAACPAIITCRVVVVIYPANSSHFVRTRCAAAPERGYPCALFYVTNGVYIFREVPYFEAFGRPPLLQQLWSLAVDEQFYLLWPLMLLLLLRRLKTDRSRLLSAIFSRIAISSGCMAVLYSNSVESLRVYYGTDTRAAGFLVGAMLAILWGPWKASDGSSRGKLEVLGWSGLAALLILHNSLNEFRPFLYRGGVLLTALASACVIMGASNPTTLLNRLLEGRVLRCIGTRSYSIYLCHRPVFMLSPPGIEIHGPCYSDMDRSMDNYVWPL